jgi:hypothetical protein
MKELKRRLIVLPLLWLAALSLALPLGAMAQSRYEPEFSQYELDQMLAPIALYPDSLLSQILMAATYPTEVAEAARWSRARPGWDGDRAVRAVEYIDWDPSVKSLVAFPQILDMMDEKLDWTQRLGDAFLLQESDVMRTVQELRERAYDAGSLSSNDYIRVVPHSRVIIVETVNPRVVHVPYYDPLIVYGSWWWPAHPPVYWAPWRGYNVRPTFWRGFAWGPGIRVSTGFFFGGCDWQMRRVNVVHVNNYYYNRTVAVSRTVTAPRAVATVNATPGQWRHDQYHRRGVDYRKVSWWNDGGRREMPAAERRQETQGHTPAQPARSESDRRADGRKEAPRDARAAAARPSASRKDISSPSRWRRPSCRCGPPHGRRPR